MQIAKCKLWHLMVAIVFAVSLTASAHAADNELSPAEKADGWILLFDGVGLQGWKNNDDKPLLAKIEEGAINPHGCGGYIMVYDKEFKNFVFKCDVKMDEPFCNSGVFLRCGDLKDPVQSSLEVQVSHERAPSLHGFAAIYDLVAPTKDATTGSGNWDSLEIRCEGPNVTVMVNGEKVNSINCDEWKEAGVGPDGRKNKYRKAIRDFPRKGYIGVQDHGYNAWFKNIKVKEL